MKKSEILNAHHLLNGDPQKGIAPVSFANVKSTKLSYAKFKNMQRLRAEAEAIEGTIKEMEPARFSELKKQIIDEVQPLIANAKNQAEIYFIEKKFISEWEHKTEWEKVSAGYNQQINEFLQTPAEIQLHNVDIADLPADLTDEQYNAISIFITD